MRVVGAARVPEVGVFYVRVDFDEDVVHEERQQRDPALVGAEEVRAAPAVAEQDVVHNELRMRIRIL